MRHSGLGVLVGAGLVLMALAVFGWRNEAAAQRTGGYEPAGELITHISSATENRQLLTVVDPRLRSIAIYHIDLTTGMVALKSVRNIQGDLMMSDFNGVSPLPREIRAMSETH